MNEQILRIILEAKNQTQASFAALKASIHGIEAETKKTAAGVSGMTTAIRGLSIGAGAAVAQMITVAATVKLITGALKAQAEQEAAINKLNLALANQGRFTQETSRSLIEYSGALQQVSTFADELILDGMAILASFGMNEAQIKKTTAVALDFAAATGTDLTTAFNLLGKAYAGNTQALGRYGIVIDQGLSKSQKFDAVVQQLGDRFGGSALTATLTYTGQMQQLKNEFGEAQESLGKFLGELGGTSAATSIATDSLRTLTTFLSKDAIIALSEFRAQWLEMLAKFADPASGIGGAVKTNLLSMFGITTQDAGFAKALREQAAEIRQVGDAAAQGAGKTQTFANGQRQLAGDTLTAKEALKLEAEAAKMAAFWFDFMIQNIKSSNETIRKMEEQASKFGQKMVENMALLGPSAAQASTEMGRLADGARLFGGVTKLSDAQLISLIDNLRTQIALGGESEAGYQALAAAMDEAANRGDKVAKAAGFATEKTEGITRSIRPTFELGEAIAFVADAYQMLGGNAESGLGRMIAALAVGAAAAKATKAALTDANGDPIGFMDASTAKQAEVALQGLNTAIAAYRSNALGGAMAGAQFGASFSLVGAAIGAAAGGLLGWIGSGRRAREEQRRLDEEARRLIADMVRMRDEFIRSQGGLEVLEVAAREAGITLEAMWDAKTVEEYEAAVDAVRAAIELHETAIDKTKEAMDRWGLTIEQMGPAFQSQMLHEALAEIFQDFSLLQAAGADLSALLSGEMGDAIDQLVGQSIAAGVALPESMRPMIEKMIELGLLIDANGNAITDVSQLTFTETLEAGVARLITEIGRLVNALLGIPNVDRTVTIHHNNQGGGGGLPGKNFDGTEDLDNDPATPMAEGGWFPYRPGGYPVTVGEAGDEAVIPKDKMAGIIAQAMQMAGGGRGSGGGTTVVHNHFHLDGRELRGWLLRQEHAGMLAGAQ